MYKVRTLGTPTYGPRGRSGASSPYLAVETIREASVQNRMKVRGVRCRTTGKRYALLELGRGGKS